MLTVVPREPMGPATRTVQFQGGPFGAGVSFFLVDNDPGQGPDLHTHPYAEIFTVVSGRALITAGEEQVEADRDRIATVGPETPHGFTNLGPGRLEIVCIHASPAMITTWLDAHPWTAVLDGHGRSDGGAPRPRPVAGPANAGAG